MCRRPVTNLQEKLWMPRFIWPTLHIMSFIIHKRIKLGPLWDRTLEACSWHLLYAPCFLLFLLFPPTIISCNCECFGSCEFYEPFAQSTTPQDALGDKTLMYFPLQCLACVLHWIPSSDIKVSQKARSLFAFSETLGLGNVSCGHLRKVCSLNCTDETSHPTTK